MVVYVLHIKMSDQKEIPSWYKPNYPRLGDDDTGTAAVKGQHYVYPEVVRKQSDPPIMHQTYGNLSFMIFDTPRRFRGKPIYGFVKLRGNHSDKDSAIFDSQRIIKEVDSKYQVRTAPVGAWVPITENISVVEEMIDVREKEEEHHLRDEAIRQREKEVQKISKELKDGEERIKNEQDVYSKTESLDFYTTKRVTETRLFEAIEVQKRKVKELELKLVETYLLCRKLEVKNPDYSDKWVDRYNEELSKTSTSAFVIMDSQLEAYNSNTLESLIEQYPEINELVEKFPHL